MKTKNKAKAVSQIILSIVFVIIGAGIVTLFATSDNLSNIRTPIIVLVVAAVTYVVSYAVSYAVSYHFLSSKIGEGANGNDERSNDK